MRLSVAVPAVVLMIASTLLGLGLTAAGQASAARRRAEAVPRTGMEILNAYACGRGETKQILVLGVEDGFSPAGSEAGFIRPGRTHAAWLPRVSAGQYDQVNEDQAFTDSFKVEGRIAGGLFVVAARSLNGGDNDTLNLGALAGDPNAGPGVWIGGDLVSALRAGDLWSVEGDVLHVDMGRVPMRDPLGAPDPEGRPGREARQSLLSYLNAGAGGGWLDVFVQDDTAIDFMGLALCRPPDTAKGVTLMPIPLSGPEHRGLIHLGCHNVRDADRRCDPYVGDTPCATALPVACIRPGNLPAPLNAKGRTVTSQWSGGDIAVTEPVRGDRFHTVAEVHAFCRQQFGRDWRVATLHDGGRNQSVSGRGDRTTVTDRVWADIVDQPHGTCWARK